MMASFMASFAEVPGRCVLIVEDECLLASNMAEEFAKLGVETIDPAGTVKRALDLLEHAGHLDGAVLDSAFDESPSKYAAQTGKAYE